MDKELREKDEAQADAVLNEAIASIQESLGVKFGDFAGVWFTGENEERFQAAVSLLADYIDAERAWRRPEAVKLEAFGCYVWLEECGSLSACEIGDFESANWSAQAVDVTAPEDQAFLDEVNRVLGSDFRLDQFAGR